MNWPVTNITPWSPDCEYTRLFTIKKLTHISPPLWINELEKLSPTKPKRGNNFVQELSSALKFIETKEQLLAWKLFLIYDTWSTVRKRSGDTTANIYF